RELHGFYTAILPSLRLENIGFHNYFRMSATKLEELLHLVQPYLSKEYYIRQPIAVEEKLMLTLRYLASGDSMTSMHYQYLVGLTTISIIISETCAVLWKTLCPLVLSSTVNTEEWLHIAKTFSDTWNFPHCIGAIDGKHVVIQCPNNCESMYYNYKNSHSLVLLAICDADYVFQFVDIGAYGRRSDGGIFKDSIMGTKLENKQLNVPEAAPISDERETPLPYCIVGDEAFPLTTYLLRPYPGKQKITPQKRIFNYRLSRARRVIENCFGILVSKWRIFRKPIIASVSTTTHIIQAAIVLHNWLRKNDLNNCPNLPYVEPYLVDQESEIGSAISGTSRDVAGTTAFFDITRAGTNTSTRTAMEVREEFCAYFNNEGAVTWQNDYV
ncbi:putative nuclease HARBI1, partial [Mycetomoellerius zeteki]|uniref:putative nuclease HARBI1 n=1 Tax=Mycetomoellerius zeteki TaxID=64791 RepID=UPI00084E3CDB